jgi:hypothetical protein
MVLKIKVIVRNDFNIEKFNIDLKKLLNIKAKKEMYKNRTKINFTILKSPHVHKDAQHTFELTSNFFNYVLSSNQVSRILSYYKKLLCSLIPDVKLILVLKTLRRSFLLNNKVIFRYSKSSLSDNDFLDSLAALSFIGKTRFLNL